jgi:CDP-6-deoxy-D-xylo-4-hexulose-3-dehydrase
MTMGEGGAVYTDNPQLFQIARSLRDWGRDCCCETGEDNRCRHRFDRQYGSLPFGYDHKYVYSRFGYNLKATDLQAAVGCAQLDKIDSFVAARKKNFTRFSQELAQYRELSVMKPLAESDPSWFGCMLTVDEKAPFSRNDLARYLEENGVQTRNLFAGNLLRHPCFEGLVEGVDYRVASELKVTDVIMNQSVWFGVYPGLNDGQIDYILQLVKSFISNKQGE